MKHSIERRSVGDVATAAAAITMRGLLYRCQQPAGILSEFYGQPA